MYKIEIINKKKCTGLIMPSAFALVLLISYSIFAPSMFFYPQTIISLGALGTWALIETTIMKGDNKIHYDNVDWVFKVGGFSGLMISVIFKDLSQTFMISMGIVVLILGILLRYLALKTLGIYFSYTLKGKTDNQQVVDYGVYRYIRHPSYLGIFLIISSLTLIHGSIPGLFVAVLFTWPLINRRISYEERMMINSFGEGYTAYSKKTKKLIPFIY